MASGIYCLPGSDKAPAAIPKHGWCPASWRESGGEPNVARDLPGLLRAAGLRVLEIHPRVRTVAPHEYAWQWVASFIEINVLRLQDLGRLTSEEGATVLREFREADADPESWFTTPMFLEIVARKE